MMQRIKLGGTARRPEDLSALRELGLEFAEISVPSPRRFSALKGAYRELLHRLGLFAVCHGPREGDPNDLVSLRRGYLPRLAGVIPAMRGLGMKLLTVHCWFDPRFVSREAIECKIALLSQVIETAAASGITICLENLSESHAHLSEVLEVLPSLQLTVDLAHGQLLTEQNTAYGFFDHYPDRIRHIHLHDNRGGDSPRDDLHLPVGEGTIDFEPIFYHLNRIGYDRTITLELSPGEIKGCIGYVNRLIGRSRGVGAS